ncbi:tereporin-Ca1-like [Mytilus galloprovincialis]|uniref:tereporin-Ca1-like n=1 Tax=Mytilus galloprovincialis TaxID=29158 RepID=UPI003F7BE471
MGNNESTYIPSDIDQKIQAVNYSVVFGIEIKNSTTHNLHSPKTTIHWGYLLSPPPTSIGPDERGSFIAHKFFGTATGTTGVVSYLVGDTDSRMVVM